MMLKRWAWNGKPPCRVKATFEHHAPTLEGLSECRRRALRGETRSPPPWSKRSASRRALERDETCPWRTNFRTMRRSAEELLEFDRLKEIVSQRTTCAPGRRTMQALAP